MAGPPHPGGAPRAVLQYDTIRLPARPPFATNLGYALNVRANVSHSLAAKAKPCHVRDRERADCGVRRCACVWLQSLAVRHGILSGMGAGGDVPRRRGRPGRHVLVCGRRIMPCGMRAGCGGVWRRAVQSMDATCQAAARSTLRTARLPRPQARTRTRSTRTAPARHPRVAEFRNKPLKTAQPPANS